MLKNKAEVTATRIINQMKETIRSERRLLKEQIKNLMNKIAIKTQSVIASLLLIKDTNTG